MKLRLLQGGRKCKALPQQMLSDPEKRVSERRCDGWEGRHSMQRNYLYKYYPILTYQCPIRLLVVVVQNTRAFAEMKDAWTASPSPRGEAGEKGVEGGSKKNQGRRAAVGSSSGAHNMEAGGKDVAELVTRRMTVTVFEVTCFLLDKVRV